MGCSVKTGSFGSNGGGGGINNFNVVYNTAVKNETSIPSLDLSIQLPFSLESNTEYIFSLVRKSNEPLPNLSVPASIIFSSNGGNLNPSTESFSPVFTTLEATGDIYRRTNLKFTITNSSNSCTLVFDTRSTNYQFRANDEYEFSLLKR